MSKILVLCLNSLKSISETLYQRRGNSGAAISHFMMDILCFCHIGFTFLLTLTANRSVPGLKMKTVISDVSNLPQ